jgi:nitrogen regulatory protein P-II 1
MKKIEAFIRADKLNDLVRKLNSMGLKELNILEAKNFDQDLIDLEAVSDLEIELTPKIKIEFIIKYTEADKYVEAIKNTVYTGDSKDGKIYVADVEKSIDISTGIEGIKAIA